MDAKYIPVLKAGAIGGVITTVCVLIFMAIIMAISGSDYICGVECFLVLLFILLTMGTGALSVAFSGGITSDQKELLTVSGLSGAIAGFAGGAAFSVIWFLTPFFISSDNPFTGSGGDSVFVTGFVSVFCGAASCGCLPAFIAAAAVSAVTGGAIYHRLTGPGTLEQA